MLVFISYSSKEYDIASNLRNVLESNEFQCWMAPSSIPAGSDYAGEIPRAIRACDVFVLVLSSASQESAWVPKEIDIAITSRKPIIPIHIDQSDLSDTFNFRLSNVQRIEAYEKVSDAYAKLVHWLKAMDKTKVEDDAKQKNSRQQPTSNSADGLKRGNICPICFNTFPKNYVLAKETNQNSTYRGGPINISEEKSFWVLTLVNNMCPREDAVAEDVRLSMKIKRISPKETVVESVIKCPNAEPVSCTQDIHFVSDKPFSLKWKNGSGFLYSEYYGLVGTRGIQISNDIMNEKGALLGFHAIDGKIPGGYNNAVTVSIVVEVVRESENIDFFDDNEKTFKWFNANK